MIVGILGVQLDIENVNARESFEQDTLAFHNRLASLRADVAESEHCGAVGHHRDQVALVGVFECILRVLLDLKARNSYTRRVGKTEIALCTTRLGGSDFRFSWAWLTVIVKSILLGDGHDCLRVNFGLRVSTIGSMRATAAYRWLKVKSPARIVPLLRTHANSWEAGFRLPATEHGPCRTGIEVRQSQGDVRLVTREAVLEGIRS